MSTASVTVQRVSRLNPKYFVFAFIGMMCAYVLVHNESFLVNPTDPVWRHYQPFRWWLLPHGLAGACALLLVPMQFSDRLRRRYTKLHRVAGRFYVAGAFIAAPLGFFIQLFQERLGAPRGFSVASASHATLWTASTAIAFAFILNGKVQQHRQWITRSVVVGPGVFLAGRVIIGITGWEKLGGAAIETVVWVCLAASFFLADLILQWEELWRSRPAPRKAVVAAS